MFMGNIRSNGELIIPFNGADADGDGVVVVVGVVGMYRDEEGDW